jgi:hypothetical protein
MTLRENDIGIVLAPALLQARGRDEIMFARSTHPHGQIHIGTTWPVTSQSNSLRTVASCCLTSGALGTLKGWGSAPIRLERILSRHCFPFVVTV